LVRAEAAATAIGCAIREHWIIEQVAKDQLLTLLGTTITSVGHELRGRLGGLFAAASLDHAWDRVKCEPSLLSDPAFVHKVDKRLEHLRAARSGTAELIELLLGVVKQSQAQVADVRACLTSAIDLVAHEASKADIELVREMGWVPPARGSRLELEQVFMNVLLNAIQQMPKSQRRRGRVIIETCFANQDERFPIKIRFTDTGPGIHARLLEKIFEPMYTTKVKGTGMGLYISRDLLAMMGGRISVEKTAILVGTTFLVELPRAGAKRGP
jgi:signal transduction histidine kinase